MAKTTFDLPARGTVSEVVLTKKTPKQADVLLIGLFSGADSAELPGNEAFDDASARAAYEALTTVGATGKALSLIHI